MPNWLQVGARHFATVSVVLGTLWWVGVPRVQAFINDTVNDRISKIEHQLDIIADRLLHIDQQLDRIQKKD